VHVKVSNIKELWNVPQIDVKNPKCKTLDTILMIKNPNLDRFYKHNRGHKSST
jgi:phage FluMu protein Com